MWWVLPEMVPYTLWDWHWYAKVQKSCETEWKYWLGVCLMWTWRFSCGAPAYSSCITSRPRKMVYPLVGAITAEPVRISCLSKTERIKPQFRPGPELHVSASPLLYRHDGISSCGNNGWWKLFNAVSYLLCGNNGWWKLFNAVSYLLCGNNGWWKLFNAVSYLLCGNNGWWKLFNAVSYLLCGNNGWWKLFNAISYLLCGNNGWWKLFNAVSYLLCGQESMAAELRLWTLIELTNNKQFYLAKYGKYVFSGTADYDEAILDCAKEGAYSCIWTLCGLATLRW